MHKIEAGRCPCVLLEYGRPWILAMVVGVLLVFSSIGMGEPGTRAGVMILTNRSPDVALSDTFSMPGVLKPRRPHPKGPLFRPPGQRHRITVKFLDGVRARLVAENELSLIGTEVPAAMAEVVARYRLRLTPVFQDVERTERMCRRAAERSGCQPPDLNGTMHVEILSRGDVLEVARALQALDCVESIDIESLDVPPPPPGDIAPPTPNLESLQVYRGADPGYDVDYARTKGADGGGVRFSDCEYGYDAAHEDLVDAGITNCSRAAIHPSVYTNNWDEHGTAALGISMAQDNGYGVSGIAPRASTAFYSEWTTAGYSRTSAIADAVADSDAGDVMLLEMQTTGAGGGYGPAELDSTVWNLTKLATDSGIIVVAAAGNGNQNLDSATYASYMAMGDSGAIIVGAGTNAVAHLKLSYSTYGARVNVQAWGRLVASTGYGTYARYGSDDHQSYTDSFSGTSSASACVGGVVCALQSYVIGRLGTRLRPGELRDLLELTGHPQGGSGGHIGPAVSLSGAIGALPGKRLGVKNCVMGSPLPGDVSIGFVGIPFRSYRIEATSDLEGWATLETGVVASAGLTWCTLEGAANGHARRFFRVVEEAAAGP